MRPHHLPRRAGRHSQRDQPECWIKLPEVSRIGGDHRLVSAARADHDVRIANVRCPAGGEQPAHVGRINPAQVDHVAESDTDRATFGSRWVFIREDTEVHVIVDRSQWLLDVGPVEVDVRSSTTCLWRLSEVRTTETVSRGLALNSQQTCPRNCPQE